MNVAGLVNTLELARELGLNQVLCPSSIAVFGSGCPRVNTPQETVLRPSTMYGVTKVTGELLCDYYVRRFGVDARGLRYPGIISAEALPGGGTTDYAVEIFYKAVEEGKYTCFLKESTRLPMMYMPDCLKATMDLMEADFERLEHHGDFNVAAMSFSAGELAAEIAKHVPGFAVRYEPDSRQAIADSWPESIDDSAAREGVGLEALLRPRLHDEGHARTGSRRATRPGGSTASARTKAKGPRDVRGPRITEPTAPRRAYIPYLAMMPSFSSPMIPYFSPTFRNAATHRSIWSSVCAADSWTRILAAPAGTTGKKNPTT